MADLNQNLYKEESKLENAGNHELLAITNLEISTETKEATALKHKIWASNISSTMLLLNTDSLKMSNGITASAWRCTEGPTKLVQFEGQCQIGNQAEVENDKIHAIQEGLHHLHTSNVSDADVVLWADNQNALRGLAGGPTAGQEYISACLEEEKILRQSCCRIRGMWTPSQKGNIGNERTNTITKKTHQTYHATRQAEP